MTRTVADVMTNELITINEEDNLSDLDEGMRTFGVRHLPVVSDGKLVGMISHRDLLRLSVSELGPPQDAGERDHRQKSSTFAASVMTRNLTTVRRDTPLLHAVRLILVNKIGCLPVVDEEQNLVGLLSELDLLREFAKDLQAETLVEMQKK
jgi:CBS domain-containing protein